MHAVARGGQCLEGSFFCEGWLAFWLPAGRVTLHCRPFRARVDEAGFQGFASLTLGTNLATLRVALEKVERDWAVCEVDW
jgi:hypothetical protein